MTPSENLSRCSLTGAYDVNTTLSLDFTTFFVSANLVNRGAV
jgi:hypothetical protein